MQEATRGYMTSEEVCGLYRITRRTLYRWNKAGKLHGVKAGRRLLFDRSEVIGLSGDGGGFANQGRAAPEGLED